MSVVGEKVVKKRLTKEEKEQIEKYKELQAHFIFQVLSLEYGLDYLDIVNSQVIKVLGVTSVEKNDLNDELQKIKKSYARMRKIFDKHLKIEQNEDELYNVKDMLHMAIGAIVKGEIAFVDELPKDEKITKQTNKK